MANKKPLDAIDGMEAADGLQEVFTQQSTSRFLDAFSEAGQQPALDFSNNQTTVAGIWIENYAGSIAESARAKSVANVALNDAALLKKIDTKARFFLVEALFPHFDLPQGWRAVAEKAGLERNIATFITNRVLAIESVADAQGEIGFIRELLRVPNEDDLRLRYQPLFTKKQLRQIADRLRRYAPEEMAKVRDARSMWRHGL